MEGTEAKFLVRWLSWQTGETFKFYINEWIVWVRFGDSLGGQVRNG